MEREGVTCFDGDTGDMPLEARRIAIRLKTGRPIMSVLGSDDYELLIEHLDDVVRSLNNDLLTLWLDEGNRVAWAEAASGAEESCLLTKTTIRRNDLGILIALSEVVIANRTDDEDGGGWYELVDELRNRYEQLNPRFREDTRGARIQHGFDKALERAEANSWVRMVDGRRVLVLPTVASLMDRGLFDAVFVGEDGRDTEDDTEPGEEATDGNN